MTNKLVHRVYELLPYAFIEKRRNRQYDVFISEIDGVYSNIEVELRMNYNVSDGRKYIWLFWYQGFDEAPQLVTRCVESIRKHANDYEVILLDKNNYAKWVELDKSILDALEKNEIGLAHFSDFLRLKLLIEYGGVWIDPTVYMTDRILDDISSADIFMFKGPNRSELLL